MTCLKYSKENKETMDSAQFTHYWVTGFGWENTIFLPTDFDTVEILGENEEGTVFLAHMNGGEGGTNHIFKGTVNDQFPNQ